MHHRALIAPLTWEFRIGGGLDWSRSGESDRMGGVAMNSASTAAIAAWGGSRVWVTLSGSFEGGYQAHSCSRIPPGS